MWQSGKNHGHTKRIMVSKTTISNNVAKMWLALKDHKPGDKSRGIVTGCTSNTRGLSNSVSDVLEAVANNEKNPYEVNSGEDMLARVHACNEKTRARREEWLERRFDKIETECNCNIEKAGLVRDCEQHRYEHTTETRLGQCMRPFWDRAAECDACGPKITARLEEECHDCGAPMSKKDLERVLLGNDVVGLFPSITSKNTGRICRERVEKSELMFEGFDYKQGGRYIVMNKRYTGNLKLLWNVLPWRRKKKGTTPGMTGKAINSEDDDPEYQWIYPKAQPTELQRKQIISRCCEIGVRVLFENFTYKFGKDWYKQAS